MQWFNRFLSSSSHCTFYFSWLPVALRRLWNWLLLFFFFFAFSLKPKCHFDSAPYKWPFRWPPPFANQKSTQSICLPLVSWRISRLAARPQRRWKSWPGRRRAFQVCVCRAQGRAISCIHIRAIWVRNMSCPLRRQVKGFRAITEAGIWPQPYPRNRKYVR